MVRSAILRCRLVPALFCCGLLALAACDDSGDDIADLGPTTDIPGDPGSPSDVPGADVLDVPLDIDEDVPLPQDALDPDTHAPDVADDAAAEDPGAPDVGPEDPGHDPGLEDPGPPMPVFCHSFADCLADEVCVLSLGECQKRATWTDISPALYGIHPREVAPGDVLIVDGRRFSAGGLTGNTPRARVGDVNVTGLQFDENRLLIPVQAGMAGDVRVWAFYNNYQLMLWPDPVAAAPAGVVPCTNQTPAASWIPGTRPDLTGPYAAGYVDLGDAPMTRVFYPAECGSVRRPPIQTEAPFPLVCILHGNGALHLQYEYLAELLATWGFVSFMPQTDQNMAGEPFQEMLKKLMPVITKMRGRALDDVHPVLAGVETTPEIAFIGHSRGTGRAEEAVGSDADLNNHAVGFVFLGPVDDDKKVRGQFLVFGGGKDTQSTAANVNSAYNNQKAPRYKIVLPGGNHGSFCDHKVYGYTPIGPIVGDLEPTIPRSLQLQIVQRFTLPLLQRAFGMDEPFADVLDSAPSTADYTITRDP